MPIQFEYEQDKVKAILLFMASKLKVLDQYKACKLLFLSDKRHLVEYGRIITGDFYVALGYGPIPSQTRDALKKLENGEDCFLKEAFDLDRSYKYPRLIPKVTYDSEVVSKSDIAVLEEIIAKYGDKSFDELKSITHEMFAYKNVWRDNQASKSFDMNFEDFFEEDENAVNGALEEMIENYNLSQAFPQNDF